MWAWLQEETLLSNYGSFVEYFGGWGDRIYGCWIDIWWDLRHCNSISTVDNFVGGDVRAQICFFFVSQCFLLPFKKNTIFFASGDYVKYFHSGCTCTSQDKIGQDYAPCAEEDSCQPIRSIGRHLHFSQSCRCGPNHREIFKSNWKWGDIMRNYQTLAILLYHQFTVHYILIGGS